MENNQKTSIQKTIEEFEVMINCKLGIDFPEETRKKMRLCHEKMLIGRDSLNRKNLKGEEYAKEASVFFKGYLKGISELLSDEDFFHLFGDEKSKVITD